MPLTLLQRLVVYEAALVVPTALWVYLAFPNLLRSVGTDSRALLSSMRREFAQDSYVHRLSFLAVLLIAIIVRILHLGQPMRVDEAWTYVHYASQPLTEALSDYKLPNNHVLHTLFVWICTQLFGN